MSDQDPLELIGTLAEAYLNSRCLHVVANLGVCDVLRDEPRSVGDLAGELSVDATALGRVMRHLASLGVFTMAGDGFSHNDASRLLMSDHPSGMLASVRMEGLRIMWDSFGVLEESVRTGRAGASFYDPAGFFSYLDSHPEESRIYDEGMTAMTRRRIERTVPHYDFSQFKVIADVGGGRGHLLSAVLDQNPGATGVVFDRDQVLATMLHHDRMSACAGNFLSDPLPSADCYLLSNIIHDWDDDSAVAILRAVRHAAGQDSRLLLFEFVVPADAEPFEASDIDIWMLALVTGRERTLVEYERLLIDGGWNLSKVIPTPSQTIVEAVPV